MINEIEQEMTYSVVSDKPENVIELYCHLVTRIVQGRKAKVLSLIVNLASMGLLLGAIVGNFFFSSKFVYIIVLKKVNVLIELTGLDKWVSGLVLYLVFVAFILSNPTILNLALINKVVSIVIFGSCKPDSDSYLH